MIHFLRPYWFIALAPLAFMCYQLHVRHHAQGAWHAVCDPALLPHVMVTYGRVYYYMALAALACTWVLVVIALSGPSWHLQKHHVYRTQAARVIVLDLSLAMQATDLKPNRLVRARYKVMDLLQRIQEGQTGLVVFAKEAYTVSPLTDDNATLSALVPALDPSLMPVQGSANVQAGVQQAMQLLKRAHATRGAIIIVTSAEPDAAALATVQRLAQQGMTSFVIGVGQDQAVPIPTAEGFLQDKQGNIVLNRLPTHALQHLAHLGGGYYYTLTADDTDVNTIVKHSQLTQQSTEPQHVVRQDWQDQGRTLVWIILVIVGCVFRRGWLEYIV